MGSLKMLGTTDWENDRIEQAPADEKIESTPTQKPALDPHGYPLRPQPSSDPNGAEPELQSQGNTQG